MTDADMQRLTALLEKHLGKNWHEVVEWLRDRNDLGAIEARLASGDMTGLVSDIQAAGARFAADTHQAYVTAGQSSAEWLDGKVPDKLIRFDQVNTRGVARAQANQLELVSGLVEEQRTTIRAVIVDGMQRGVNPRAMARDIKATIGLTASQADAVLSYRRALESKDYANALGRELRDARTDRTLIAAGRADVALDAGKIDAMVDRYRVNFVAHRATVISRTEGLKAANEGSAELIRQSIDRGDIEADQLVKTWNAGPRTRHARQDHQAMDGKSVPVLEDFVLPDGARMAHPGDPRGGAAHTIQCRCTVSTKFKSDRAPVASDPAAAPARPAASMPDLMTPLDVPSMTPPLDGGSWKRPQEDRDRLRENAARLAVHAAAERDRGNHAAALRSIIAARKIENRRHETDRPMTSGAPAPDPDPTNILPWKGDARGNKDTLAAYRRGNTWDASRTVMHEAYASDVLDGVPKADGGPTVYMTGGGPASGKTSAVLRNPRAAIPGDTKAVHVNPDDAKEFLTEFVAGKAAGDKSAAAFVHEESSDMTKEVSRNAVKGGRDLVLDVVGDSGIEALSKRVGVLRDAGAKSVEASYVTIDIDEAVRRSDARYRNAAPGSSDNRFVPHEYIRAAHTDVSRTVVDAIKSGVFDKLAVWDNEGRTPILIASYTRSGGLVVKDPRLWALFEARGTYR